MKAIKLLLIASSLLAFQLLVANEYTGTCLEFDGIDDFVEVTDHATLDFTTEYTIEVWIKPNSFGALEGIVSKYNSPGSNGYMLRLSADPPYTGLNFDEMTTTNGILEAGNWYHITAVNDNGTRRLYLNGEEQLLSGTALIVEQNSDPLCIGVDYLASGRYFDGKIDELRLTNDVRTEIEIREEVHLIEEEGSSYFDNYWHFNEGSGTWITSDFGSCSGSLKNMDDTDWVNSTILASEGRSDTEIISSTGISNLNNAYFSMDVTDITGTANIVASRLDKEPNILPTGLDEVFDNEYWVVNNYGTGTITADISFNLVLNIENGYEYNPQYIKLYGRSRNSEGVWSFVANASSVDIDDHSVAFKNISNFEQFIICRNDIPPPSIVLLSDSLSFTSMTNSFNSIDIGYNSIPTFTDLDGNGLLDMLVGESTGIMNHYEQDAENSTSFSLVTDFFNSIDVGSESKPTFIDLDGNGLLDMLIGESSGNINHYEQDEINSTTFTLVAENFNNIAVGDNSAPSFTDLDGDGLLDMLIGKYNGSISHYEQDAQNSTSFSLVTASFNDIAVSYSVPSFTDLGGNRLLDMFVGEFSGNISYYEQDAENSTNFTLVTTSFNDIAVEYSAPSFTDLDGDGLLDLIIGDYNGDLYNCEQEDCDSLNFGSLYSRYISGVKKYLTRTSNLKNELSIACPEGYKVSLSENSGFETNLSVAPINGTVSDTIFLRFEPTAEQEYSGDISHTSQDATIKNIALLGYGIEIDGFPGKTLEFDGVEDFVDCGNDTSLDIIEQITIESWINVSSWASNVWEGNIINKEYDHTGYMLRCGELGRINFNIGTGVWNELTTDTSDALDLNTWYHIAATYDGASQKIYINGKLVKEKLTTNDIQVNTHSLYIGSSQADPNRLFDGKIDEIKLWNKGRTESEIREGINHPLGGYESGLVSFWQFNEGSGNILKESKSANNGTLNNMDDSDWVDSTIPFGDGFVDSHIISSTGIVDFTNTNVTIEVTAKIGIDTFVVSKIELAPNILPVEVTGVFDRQYWVINSFGAGTTTANISFTVSQNVEDYYEDDTQHIKLYGRDSNSDSDWVYLSGVTTVNANNNTVTFNGISNFKQFIVTRNFIPSITLLSFPMELKNKGHFNSIDVGSRSAPSFTDLDGDGLLDMLIGENAGNINHYEQNSENSTSFSIVTESFNSIDVGAYSIPTFTDLDGDELLDMLIGEHQGKIYHYEQDAKNSTSFTLISDNFNSIDVGSNSAPSFTDLDGDGLLDMLIGEYYGKIHHYEQDAVNSTSFNLITDNFNSIDLSSSVPTFTDIDGDGLLDLLVGKRNGWINHYEQDADNSTSFSLVTDGFLSIDVGDYSIPSFTDLNKDGAIDMFIGGDNGNINHYEQGAGDNLDFGNILVGNSPVKRYYLIGTNLTNDLNISCTENYQLSLSENSGFQTNLSILQVDGIVSDTVFVKSNPTEEGEYLGSISHTSQPAEARNTTLECNGTVVDTIPGKGLEFSGWDDYIDCGNASSLSIIDSLTIEFWIRSDEWFGRRWIISKEYDNTGYMLRVYANGTLDFSIGTGNLNTLTTDIEDSLSLNTWYHIAATYDGIKQKLFIDGKLVKEKLTTGGIWTNNTSLFIGSSGTYGLETLHGKLDEVRIWDTARTELEIRGSKNLSLQGNEPGLVSYWQLNEISGNTTDDIISGNHGVLFNMDDYDWFDSTIPFGNGFVDSQIISSTGIVDFIDTGFLLNVTAKTGIDTIVISKINLAPNRLPEAVTEVYDDQYWVINKYGSGTTTGNVSFTLNEDIASEFEYNPSALKLYGRAGNSDLEWNQISEATSVNLIDKTVTFNEILNYDNKQLIITNKFFPSITLMNMPMDFTHITDNIIVGEEDMRNITFTNFDNNDLIDLLISNNGELRYYEQDSISSTSFTLISNSLTGVTDYNKPALIDLDGDGLLDMLIQKSLEDYMRHYEQDSYGSTSFTLVSEVFNDIHVGDDPMPAFTDLNIDGLLDLMIGDYYGNIHHYEQDAENSTNFTLVTETFNGIELGTSTVLDFTDLDDDGLIDMLVGNGFSEIHYYEQTTENSTNFTFVKQLYDFNGANLKQIGIYDLDNDGLLDIFAGKNNENPKYYEQGTCDNLDLGDVSIGSFSEANYYLKAKDLKNDLNIACAEGYKVSLSRNSGFQTNLAVIPVNNTISDTIFVQFEPTDVQEYSGSISHTSAYAETKNISVIGHGYTEIASGTALEFDGIDDFVDCGNDTSLDIIEQITIETWIKASSWQTNVYDGNIINKEYDNTGYMLRCGDLGKLNFNIGSGSWNELTTDAVDALDLNKWYHVAATYDGEKQKIYINGKLVKEKLTYDSIYTNSHPLYIGSSQDHPDKFFDGKIDEVVLWDVARTESEIRENMYLPKTGNESGIVSYWQYNEASGDIIRDILSGNNGTLNNMDDENWIDSSIPFGKGFVNTRLVSTTGIVDFTDTGLSIDFIEKVDTDSIIVTRIDALANTNPTEPATSFDEQYWVINRYDATVTSKKAKVKKDISSTIATHKGTISANLTFTIEEDLIESDEENPTNIKLYTRGNTADSNWEYLTDAVSVIADTDEVTFNGITEFGQFIVTKGSIKSIGLLNTPISFDNITENFNGIDGDIASPSFTDLDGDGLLDMLIGQENGRIQHYEQNSENSTSFTLVTHLFDGIDVGEKASPTFTDFDGDGLLDMVISSEVDGFKHYEQNSENSTSFRYIGKIFDSIYDTRSNLAFTDLDGDNLIDMFIAEVGGDIHYYEQNSENSTSFTLVVVNFIVLDEGSFIKPSFTDLDGNGLLDLLVGHHLGKIAHYEQNSENSTSFTLVTNNFEGINVGDYSSPTFTDLDGDGLLDMLIGEGAGNINHYEQLGCSNIFFGNELAGEYSIENYIVKTGELTSNLAINCSGEGYQISLNENTGYQSNLSIAPNKGVASDTVFVRYSPTAKQEYSGNISHTCTGSETKDISLAYGVEIDGFPGTNLEFDGVDDFVNCGNDTSLDIIEEITIESWINVSSWTSNVWEGNIINKEYNRTGYMLRCGENGRINFNIGTGDWNELTTDVSDVLYLNTWYHIAATYDGMSQKIYVNGELVKEKLTTNDIQTNTHSLYIGASQEDPSRLFDGKIDEVRLWNIARTVSQIRKDMHTPLSENESGIVSYWQFNEASGNKIRTLNSTNNGTLNNMNDNDWIDSSIPFGKGFVNTQLVSSTGIVDFSDTGIFMNFIEKVDTDSIVVTRIDTLANINPTDLNSVFDNQYWVINKYDAVIGKVKSVRAERLEKSVRTVKAEKIEKRNLKIISTRAKKEIPSSSIVETKGTFTTSLTFTVSEDLTEFNENDPTNIKLYTRGSTADSNWVYLADASSVVASTDEVTFDDITEFGQFIIGELVNSSSIDDEYLVPKVTKLYQNYPNPFNPITTIKFDLSKDSRVKLVIYNSNGQSVKTLLNNEMKHAGRYSFEFNGNSLTSGLYFYSIQAGKYNKRYKAMLIK